MPLSIQPLLTVSPALPTQALEDVHCLLGAVAHGAFGSNSGYRIILVHSAHTNCAEYQLEFTSADLKSYTNGIALRLAETTLLLITALAKGLGLQARLSNIPSSRMLCLAGLTWYQTGCRLRKIIAMLESPRAVEFTSLLSALRVRIATGCPLRNPEAQHCFLCLTIIRRRMTSSAEVVRIKFGENAISIIVPHEIGAAAVSHGAMIHTTQVVGLIPRRLVQIERCQLSLFESPLDR